MQNAQGSMVDLHSTIHLDREACLRIERAQHREWFEVDGLGGFASSTVHLCPTRRYHGLLTGYLPSGGKRHMFLARLEEELIVEGRAFPISTCRYPGTYHPEGWTAIESFELDPHPCWTYRVGLATLRREILVPRGHKAVLIRWTLGGERTGINLRVRPLFAVRGLDELQHENVDLNTRAQRTGSGVDYQAYGGLPTTHLVWSLEKPAYAADPLWYRQVEYTCDIARGYGGHEDQFAPGRFDLSLEPGMSVTLAASFDAPIEDPAQLFEHEVSRRRTARTSGLLGLLEEAGEKFMYKDSAGRPGILAGFPWFEEWGRDTFIALPGLTLSRGDLDGCKAVLAGALPFLRGGLLPNIYGPDVASSHYGSADAALWFSRAARLYIKAGGDTHFIRAELQPALVSIAEAYLEGSDLGLRVDSEGLLFAGSEGLNATWMDAQYGGEPVTPRAGAPVELNALWYALLGTLEELHEGTAMRSEACAWRRQADKTSEAFLQRFWLPKEGYLADVWDGECSDSTLRPNQIVAAALDLSPLSMGKRTDVVAAVKSVLLTPKGLRTLDPRDERYIGRYQGDARSRDLAYHQGTVWPWLLGMFTEASLRVLPMNSVHVRSLTETLGGFEAHLSEYGLGSIAEVFDGDPPHRPAGCPAQAWSVAEVLRSLVLLKEHGPCEF
ncbi:MAG TPA: glycogen debranching protein [Planctomycetes bacterium]|nr:glycogen debranching protein [Planctomycetota bacterium]HIL36327.1 glycogen debranching protein [Planctomycetota bacterium]